MFDIHSIDDFNLLRESSLSLTCRGRDKGELPHDFWQPTALWPTRMAALLCWACVSIKGGFSSGWATREA